MPSGYYRTQKNGPDPCLGAFLGRFSMRMTAEIGVKDASKVRAYLLYLCENIIEVFFEILTEIFSSQRIQDTRQVGTGGDERQTLRSHRRNKTAVSFAKTALLLAPSASRVIEEHQKQERV